MGCNLYVDCDNEVFCYEPGPTTGTYVNPHIGIIGDGGESYLEFIHESSEETCAQLNLPRRLKSLALRLQLAAQSYLAIIANTTHTYLRPSITPSTQDGNCLFVVDSDESDNSEQLEIEIISTDEETGAELTPTGVITTHHQCSHRDC